jgi:peptidyl-prolyl cis-trans isomerase A (cyclophilin A)
MRKLILLVLVAAFAFTACDKNAKNDETATAETTTTASETTADSETSADDSANATTENADTGADGTTGESGAAAAPEEVEVSPELLDPSKATETAPDTYKVKFETTKGDFVAKIDRSLAPKGADRLYNLVKLGYYNDVAFFRVIDGFMAQFGIHGAPKVNKVWREAHIQDDPVKESNTRGMLTFATAGPNTRTTQLFINFKDNSNLDGMGFAPIGKVDDEGMKVVDSLYKGYGEGAPRGAGPNQGLMQAQGNPYLKENFPKLDYIKSASIVE